MLLWEAVGYRDRKVGASNQSRGARMKVFIKRLNMTLKDERNRVQQTTARNERQRRMNREELALCRPAERMPGCQRPPIQPAELPAFSRKYRS